MREDIAHEMNLATLPGRTLETPSGGLHQATVVIRDDVANIFEATLF
jgi:hypothetical protein